MAEVSGTGEASMADLAATKGPDPESGAFPRGAYLNVVFSPPTNRRPADAAAVYFLFNFHRR